MRVSKGLEEIKHRNKKSCPQRFLPEIQRPSLGLHINSGQCCMSSCACHRLKLLDNIGQVVSPNSF